MFRPGFKIALTATALGIYVSSVCALPPQSTSSSVAEPHAKNQASAADTVILPPEEHTDKALNQETISHLQSALKNAGLNSLRSLALVDGTIDEDGCEEAPITASRSYSIHHTSHTASTQYSLAVQALADQLQAHGFTVTVLHRSDLMDADNAEQARLAASKGGGYSAQFGNSKARLFPSNEERSLCLHIVTPGSPEAAARWKVKHPALQRQMAALHQDAILVVEQDSVDNRGASWNIMDEELSSSGDGVNKPRSSAKVEATLVLKDGTVPWSGEAIAEGALRPPLDQEAVSKLKTFMEAKLTEWKKEQEAHPDEDPTANDKSGFDAIASGKLEEAPDGSTLGPSEWATVRAATQRLYEQFAPGLVAP